MRILLYSSSGNRTHVLKKLELEISGLLLNHWVTKTIFLHWQIRLHTLDSTLLRKHHLSVSNSKAILSQSKSSFHKSSVTISNENILTATTDKSSESKPYPPSKIIHTKSHPTKLIEITHREYLSLCFFRWSMAHLLSFQLYYIFS